MDLARALAEYELDAVEKRTRNRDKKLVLIAPAGEEMPNDGFLNYATVGDVQAIVNAQSGSVLLFAEKHSRLLEMLIEYQDEFGVTVKTLVGLPGVKYEPWFESKSWSQDDVSYSSLLSEMSIAEEHRAFAREKERTTHDVERSQYSRNDGTVKRGDNFDVQDDIGDEVEGES